MKAILRTPRLTIELEGNSPKDLFRTVAETQEVFGEKSCGKCESENIQYRVRTVNGDEYFEMVCTDCGSALSFGQAKKKSGHLFPIRKVTEQGRASRKDGKYDKQHRGWTQYRGEVKDEGEK